MRGSDEGVAFGQRARQLRGYPEVRYLDGGTGTITVEVASSQQDVAAFDVSVYLSQGVEVRKTLERGRTPTVSQGGILHSNRSYARIIYLSSDLSFGQTIHRFPSLR